MALGDMSDTEAKNEIFLTGLPASSHQQMCPLLVMEGSAET